MALIGYGTGVGKALGAADLLAERGLDVTVADARFAKPLDALLLASLAADHDLLVTVEEGVLAGGFGSAVWECLSDEGAARAADPARRAARIATSRTALRRCCTKKSGSRPSASPSGSRRPCSTRASPFRHLNAVRR